MEVQSIKRRKVQLGLGSFFKIGDNERSLSLLPNWKLPERKIGRPATAKQMVEAEAAELRRQNEVLRKQLEEQALVPKEPACVKPSRGGAGRRSTAQGRTTNKRLQAEKQKRIDLSASVKHKICLMIEEEKKDQASEKCLWASVGKKLGHAKWLLRRIWERRDEWSQLVIQESLSQAEFAERKFSGAKQGRKAQTSKIKLRMRASGAGRKRSMDDVENKLKTWAHQERAFGHAVSKRALVLKYKDMLRKHFESDKTGDEEKQICQKRLVFES